MNSNDDDNSVSSVNVWNFSSYSVPFVSQSLTIHVVSDCEADRAARAKSFFSMGYHVEIYANSDELLTHRPSNGIIFIRDDNIDLTIDLINKMKISGHYLPIIGYCTHFDVDKLIQSIKVGAIDFVTDSTPPQILREKIEHGILQSKSIKADFDKRREASLLMSTLTKREFNVLALLADGHTSKEIARELEISPRTVEIHRRHILRKFSVKTTIHAVYIKYILGNMAY